MGVGGGLTNTLKRRMANPLNRSGLETDMMPADMNVNTAYVEEFRTGKDSIRRELQIIPTISSHTCSQPPYCIIDLNTHKSWCMFLFVLSVTLHLLD